MAEKQSLNGVLSDMIQYFMFCKANAAKGSAAERKFTVYVEAVSDAKRLLKAQEPRVMNITEAMDAEVAWLEKYGENEIKPVIIMSYEYGYWECLIYDEDDAEILLTIDGFNTDWRCWTSRPTDEQREATPWQPPKEGIC